MPPQLLPSHHNGGDLTAAALGLRQRTSTSSSSGAASLGILDLFQPGNVTARPAAAAAAAAASTAAGTLQSSEGGSLSGPGSFGDGSLQGSGGGAEVHAGALPDWLPLRVPTSQRDSEGGTTEQAGERYSSGGGTAVQAGELELQDWLLSTEKMKSSGDDSSSRDWGGAEGGEGAGESWAWGRDNGGAACLRPTPMAPCSEGCSRSTRVDGDEGGASSGGEDGGSVSGGGRGRGRALLLSGAGGAVCAPIAGSRGSGSGGLRAVRAAGEPPKAGSGGGGSGGRRAAVARTPRSVASPSAVDLQRVRDELMSYLEASP